MSHKWFTAVLISLGLILLLLPQALPARAQEPTPANDANCVSCHEHRYYLYDEGSYFCLCEAPMHCIYCHGGQADSYDKTVAHEGLVLYPTRHEAEQCQTCHSEDYMERVVTFSENVNISSTPIPIITATPAEQAVIAADLPPAPLLRLGQLDPWRQATIVILVIAILGMLVLGYRCWRSDCRAKIQL